MSEMQLDTPMSYADWNAFPEPPASLGGTPWSLRTIMFLLTLRAAYCSLGRLATLPPLSQVHKMKDEEARSAFLRMSDGDVNAIECH